MLRKVAGQRFRLVELNEMACGLDVDKTAIGDVSMKAPTDFGTEIDILLTTDDESWDSELLEGVTDLQEVCVIQGPAESEETVAALARGDLSVKFCQQLRCQPFFVVERATNNQTEHSQVESCHGQLPKEWRSHGNNRLNRPEIIGHRVDQRQAVKARRMAHGKDLADTPADVVADKMKSVETKGVREIAETVRMGPDGLICLFGSIRSSTPQQVNSDNVPSVCQLIDDREPNEGVRHDSVKEYHRLSAACAAIGKVAPVNRTHVHSSRGFVHPTPTFSDV